MTADLFSETSKPYTNDPLLSKKLQDILSDISSAESHFNLASDPCEIEAIIYRMKSLEAEYSYIIRAAKLQRINSEVNLK